MQQFASVVQNICRPVPGTPGLLECNRQALPTAAERMASRDGMLDMIMTQQEKIFMASNHTLIRFSYALALAAMVGPHMERETREVFLTVALCMGTWGVTQLVMDYLSAQVHGEPSHAEL